MPYKWLFAIICLIATNALSAQNSEDLNLVSDTTAIVSTNQLQKTNAIENDSALIYSEGLLTDTISSDVTSEEQPSEASSKSGSSIIDAEVIYSAKDSTFFDRGKVYLYGDASVSYQNIQLTAHFIELDLETNMAFAEGTRDSLGVEVGLPVFKDKSGEYTMRRMRYNFKTEKAIIEHVVTTQGEGYVVSELAKKNADDTFFLKDGRYTTCDHHDHPHFYINMTRAKVIPGDKIVAGPAYLVVEDVKIFPLIIPFAFVPTTQSYSSGFLMPSYGEESNRGFFLRDGGYYFAFNDYFDFALTGDIYANASWGVRASSSYHKRYRYRGNFHAQRITNNFSEKDLPDYRQSKDFSLTWRHNEDAKAHPYRTFGANVNISTSSFNQNNVGSVINPQVLAQSTNRSSVTYSRQFPGTPFNMSMNALHSQNSRDSTVNVTIPDLTVTMNRIYPLKNKNRIGSKEAWYENLSLGYSGTMSNNIHTKESEFSMTPTSLANDWKNGARHSIPISLNLKVLKYFTVTPNVSYTERWYLKSIEKDWDEEAGKIVVSDTISGFQRVYDYRGGVSTSTKLYTFYKPSRAIFGDKIDAVRHVMTPSASMSYTPDFGTEKFGYYDWFEYYNPTSDEIVTHTYSRYENSLYGTPGTGESASLGLSLGNTLEMKVKSDRDSTGFQKINIIESLNFSTSYNYLADSLNWSRISMSGRTKIFGTNINFGATFDPYVVDTNKVGAPIRVQRYELHENKRLARLESANLSFGINFGSETLKKWRSGSSSAIETDEELLPEQNPFEDINSMDEQHMQSQHAIKNVDPLQAGDDGYVPFEIPWNISVNYSMRLVNDGFNKEKMAYNQKISADINLSGRVTLTKKWDLSASSGYNIDRKEISHTNLRINRNLHCWNMSFNLVPVGRYKSFFFNIAVNSSLLRDLKYDKRSHPRDNPSWR